MKKKTPLTFLERVELGKRAQQIDIKELNEPNMKLMAEAAINLYHQHY